MPSTGARNYIIGGAVKLSVGYLYPLHPVKSHLAVGFVTLSILYRVDVCVSRLTRNVSIETERR